MKKQRRMGISGQVLTEFALMAVVFTVIACTMLLLLSVFSEYGWRILSFVSWEPFS